MYPEERILGNTFIINCKVGIENHPVNSIKDTIDYAALLEIVKKHFSAATPLLETLAQNIESESKLLFPDLKYFLISIQKKNPALNAQLESSEIILEKQY